MSSHDAYIDRTAQLYAAHGLLPPWERVWHEGVDITETEPPEAWGWPFSRYFKEGWRPLVWVAPGVVGRMSDAEV